MPSSDVDLLLVIDRPVRYLPYFDKIPMGVDCFVYTVEEIKSGKHLVAETVLKDGTVLYKR